MTKYVFVTGGVVSGLGKGIVTASLGRLMKARGFSKEDFARFHPAGQLGRNLLLNVRDIMSPLSHCAVVNAANTVREVVIAMTRFPLGAACVLDENGVLTGIVTDGDVRRMLQSVVDLDALTCGEMMTKKPICIEPDASLGRAVKLMEERKSKISVLPVVDGGGKYAIMRLISKCFSLV